MNLKELTKFVKDNGLKDTDELLLWSWNGKASRFQRLNITCGFDRYDGYISLGVEPYSDDVKPNIKK